MGLPELDKKIRLRLVVFVEIRHRPHYPAYNALHSVRISSVQAKNLSNPANAQTERGITFIKNKMLPKKDGIISTFLQRNLLQRNEA